MVFKVFRRSGGGGLVWLLSNYWIFLATGINFVAISNQVSPNPAETQRQVLIPRAGTLRLFCLRFTTNTTVVADTMVVRINEADATQTFVVPALTTGNFQDITNTDPVILFDRVNYEVIETNGAKTLHSGAMMIE